MPKDPRERAEAWTEWLQREEDAHGRIAAAKQARAEEEEHRAEPIPAAGPGPDETCDAWYQRYFAYQKELGRSSAKDAFGCWR